MANRLSITLNARLRPLDRGSRYEDPLQKALDDTAPGSRISGGGTLLTSDREPAYSDIEMDVEGDVEMVLRLVIATLEEAGAPKGSRARLDDAEPISFGTTEGLAVYLNGVDLPDQTYATSDINELVAALLERLGADGHMQSWWQGPRETALYLYGPSASHIADAIADVLTRFPLAERCRVVPLELVLPHR